MASQNSAILLTGVSFVHTLSQHSDVLTPIRYKCRIRFISIIQQPHHMPTPILPEPQREATSAPYCTNHVPKGMDHEQTISCMIFRGRILDEGSRSETCV